ncbi:MAG: hypothetical protein JWQ34_1662 [Mucilaginibacter sp.]|uniref:hypothetical protein n=1 Tax=Mucilaginibacter sp. TaxID=1882438 RepID=UPI0026033EF0|nr:hypothetical protein [Mucilaginibacter sp.]MDB5003437.1 hypothetical protein [Mucilaginibacter sp.]
MPFHKNQLLKSLLLFIVPVFLSSCHLFDEAKQRLQLYCPGLKISLNGVNIQEHAEADMSDKKLFVLTYFSGSEQAVKSYFLNKANGFKIMPHDAIFKKESEDDDSDDHKTIENTDIVFGKTVTQQNGYTIVMFNQTKNIIIIAEYSKGQRKKF